MCHLKLGNLRLMTSTKVVLRPVSAVLHTGPRYRIASKRVKTSLEKWCIFKLSPRASQNQIQLTLSTKISDDGNASNMNLYNTLICTKPSYVFSISPKAHNLSLCDHSVAASKETG